MIKQNKKGGAFFNVIIVVAVLALILVVGVIAAFGGMTVKWVSDNVAPSFKDLGMAGDANLSQIGTMTVTPIQNVVASFSWISGIGYVLALLMVLGLSFAFRITGNKWLMVLFFVCMFLLLVTSIFISNIYQDFYDSPGEVGVGLHDMVLLSFMLLYSPVIITVIGFISGIIMFTGGEEDVYA